VTDQIQLKRLPPFPSRATVIAAANMLKVEGNSGFEALRLEYDLQHTKAGLGSGLLARATSLATYALQYPEARTPEGIPLQTAIVARAGEHYRSGIQVNIGEKEREAFKLASSRDGSLNDVTESGEDIVIMHDGFVEKRPAAPMKSQQSLGAPEVQLERSKRVFIVHGHDDNMKLSVSNFLTAIGLEPVILADQVNAGKTIIEKFERNADVGYAVVLLAPDDYSPQDGYRRARQNVILEWGYFIGRLGRSHVCALKRGHVDLPSDIIGIVWENFDEDGGWKRRLVKELIEAGVAVDEHKAHMA
jgi:predicted nucleotide-binding protein